MCCGRGCGGCAIFAVSLSSNTSYNPNQSSYTGNSAYAGSGTYTGQNRSPISYSGPSFHFQGPAVAYGGTPIKSYAPQKVPNPVFPEVETLYSGPLPVYYDPVLETQNHDQIRHYEDNNLQKSQFEDKLGENPRLPTATYDGIEPEIEKLSKMYKQQNELSQLILEAQKQTTKQKQTLTHW